MITLLGAAALAALAWWLSGHVAGRDAERRMAFLRRTAEAAAGLAALVLLLRGRVDMALLLAGLGLSLNAARTGTWPGARWLQAQLHRGLARRREHAERDAHARPAGLAPAMTEEQAYQVLGLEPGADAEAVLASHRRLVKRVHPDHGGSAELAARVNQARDVLLGRHR